MSLAFVFRLKNNGIYLLFKLLLPHKGDIKVVAIDRNEERMNLRFGDFKENFIPVIGDVRSQERLDFVFRTYQPQVVFHAAAYKHVPLMEENPCEAVFVNVAGSRNVADKCIEYGVEKMVMISTDKAVNPTNIMGASKRLCEMIIQSFDAKIKAGKADELPQLFTHKGVENADKDGSGTVFKNVKTEFVAVRFGNVLGSNISNILLILGGAALINPLSFAGMTYVDLGIILIGALVILASAFMFKKKELDRYEGAIFVLMEIGYMWYLIANL